VCIDGVEERVARLLEPEKRTDRVGDDGALDERGCACACRAPSPVVPEEIDAGQRRLAVRDRSDEDLRRRLVVLRRGERVPGSGGGARSRERRHDKQQAPRAEVMHDQKVFVAP
jgi:hypothetical protein